MEEVEIADINDDDFTSLEKQGPLENADLSVLSLTVGDILAQYGWYIMVVTVLLFLLIQHMRKRSSSQSSSTTSSPARQDSVSVVRRQEAVEAARRRMQEDLDAKAAVFKEKQKQQEEEKRRQKIEMWESMKQGKSYKGNAKHSQTNEEANSATTVLKQKTEKKPLRNSGSKVGDVRPSRAGTTQ
ncbi:selenoprotein S, partial [Thalassophryne amazonica]|uniref:selenoprotein S n=1 Tax=Thalassophryne amazonica TaxID=390379 RepID=UPI001471F3E0